jgi:hypothetical protein
VSRAIFSQVDSSARTLRSPRNCGVGETYEALLDGRGIVLLASGNAPLVALDGVITRPVRGLSPSRLVLAWRAGDDRPLVHDYVRACANWRARSATA